MARTRSSGLGNDENRVRGDELIVHARWNSIENRLASNHEATFFDAGGGSNCHLGMRGRVSCGKGFCTAASSESRQKYGVWKWWSSYGGFRRCIVESPEAVVGCFLWNSAHS